MNNDKRYKTKRWRKFRESILKRDGYICKHFSRYGKTKSAEMVHHIYPTEDYPELFYNPYNLISLSNEAHELMHNRVTGEITIEGKRLQDRLKEKIWRWQEKI